MNKTTKIIITAIIIIMLAAGFFAFFIGRKPTVTDEQTGTGKFPDSGESAGRTSSRILGEGASSSRTGKETPQNVLTQLTKNAISGAAYYGPPALTSQGDVGRGTTTALYMERATGHIYKINLDGTNKIRLSNATVPKSFEASWSYKSDKMAVRYFEDPVAGSVKLTVKTFLASIGHLLKATSTSEAELKGLAMPATVSEIAVSPAEDKIFYLNSLDNDTTEGVVADFNNKNQKKIFELPFGEFNVSWPTKDNIVLLTKPSAKADGYLYFLNAKTGALTKILGNMKGFTALVSPNGEKVAFSLTSKDGVKTGLFDVKQKTYSELGFDTFADKCVWGKKNNPPTGRMIYCAIPARISGPNQPDGWYQGVVSFNDGVWSKNVSTGESQNILSRFGADIINIFISDDENYLIFTDKNDGTLWSLKLKKD